MALALSENLMQRAVNFQSTIVVDQSLFSEAIHKEVHTRTRRAYHFCQDLMAKHRNFHKGRPVSVQARQPEENQREPLFCGAGQKIRDMFLIILHFGQ
jgi:hypothetical protein